jgi:sigma-B regulation protein RsbU (phosphoserine phosphatase)
LMEHASYCRGDTENVLTMRRSRRTSGEPIQNRPSVSTEEMSRRLYENEQIIADLAEELSSCYESLSAIFRYGAEQSGALGLRDFSRRLLSDLLRVTVADWFVLRLADSQESKLVAFAASEPEPGPDPLDLGRLNPSVHSVELEAALTRRDVWFDHPDALSPSDPLGAGKSGSIGLVHPFYVGDTLVGTLSIGKSRVRTPFTAAKINVIHTFADFLAIQIVNARLQEERVNTLLVARDLEIAQTIQRSLLLDALPQLPGVGIAGYCVSARQVGGDFYDVIKLSDTSLLLVIADVMGKGIPAAMFAVILRSLLRALPEWTNRPSELLSRANHLLFGELSKVDMFITAQLAFVDARTRRLVAASAGHCPILVANEGRVRAVSPEGMPLGILPTTAFGDETVELDEGCRVLLYTDGLTEARNPSGELFGGDRLGAWLGEHAHSKRTADQMKDQLALELVRFQANLPLNDDQTFLIIG